MMGGLDSRRDERQRSFSLFAKDAARGGSPLYASLAGAIAGDANVQAIVAARREGQPAPNLIFAATHFLILRGAEHPLRRYYATVGGAALPDAQTLPLFLDFCARHQAELTALVAAHATNTNEAGRSALIAAGLAHLSRLVDQPLYLIELGPSAGLNLNFDRYAYRFCAPGGEEYVTYWGPSPLTIEGVAQNSVVPDLGVAPPPIAGRLGLERDPVDCSMADNRDWLKALVWPERAERHQRLAAALEIARDYPPPIESGDANAMLRGALARAPSGAARCVFHTAVTYQFSAAARAGLEDIFEEESRTAPLWRLSLEWCEGDLYPLTLARYESGAVESQDLAFCDPHGRWIDWRH